ncbi:DUF4012 domain-containing protein [Agromyces sp. NPDC058110]|uniref:DUF4012 domain-containing protein n=1 Tax=Agromyces sp. NPDC058110 TaxID=3346345 RepID=UPI0036DE3FFA
MTGPHTDDAAPTTRTPGRRARAVLIGCGVLVVAVLAAAAWIGVRGWLAKSELEAAAEAGEEAASAMLAHDADAAEAAADGFGAHAAEAARLTGDPIWAVAEAIPWVGDDLAAASTMARELDRVASDAVLPLVAILGDLDPNALRDSEGRIDVARIASVAPVIHGASTSIGTALDRVSGIPSEGLFAPVASAREQFVGALDRASGVAGAVDDAVSFVPAALGSEGARQYLILSLNNAELRTAGGIPGAIALVSVEDGVLTLVRQAGAYDFSEFASPLALDDGTRAVFGDEVGRYIQNITMTPDFAETGELAAGMWQQTFGDRIDGVVALDPIALSYLLAATGPVTVPGAAPIDADNAVERLLVDPYRVPTFDQFARDRYFGAIAAATLTSMLSQPVDLGALVSSVGRAGDEHRLSIWSAHPDEQAALERSTFAGLLAAQQESGDQTYGVYLNDSTAAKLDPYLGVSIDVGAAPADDGGRAEVTVRVTLENTVTQSDLALMPSDASGAYREGFGHGRIATIVTVSPPEGTFDGGVVVDGERVAYASRDGFAGPANSLPVDIEPGATIVLEFRFTSAEPGQVDPQVVHTPLIRQIPIGRL